MTDRRPAAPTGEDHLIAELFRPIARHPGALGLIDDAACIAPPPGEDLVLTKDALVAGVHFFPEDPPDSIARKALRVNLSDLAAKGATPLAVLLAIAIPKDMPFEAMAAFARGLGADTAAHGVPLLGGDTVRTTGPLVVSITALGTLPRGEMVTRSGARPGQAIVVTGTIGDAALGLALRLEPKRPGFAALDPAQRAHLADRYLHPRPRLGLAGGLRAAAGGAMDVSDGLVGDLAKLLAVSGVSGDIDAARVPLSPAARAAIAAEPALLEVALTGGDDYEILATVADDKLSSLGVYATAAGIPVTVIGRTGEGAGLVVKDAGGASLTFARASFSHF
ncbi:thiamine-phosphate kinase [Ancylobacter sp. 6x-1]|uniref:Thiamine-monophosphate kinase n=1 Tax=Ancylobacter crimeensis TaxID=2579147 RepID=A0ABT0D6Y6_9HYPH|nr:thiamine-phosphate kinase [Ancylobacter crimeensis]MCK0195701.1 thiamine-phosphate kinase [Ancylobacter crimeensis]